MYGEGNQGGGFRPRGGPGGFAPVKVGEELDVRIEAVGEKGDGIARKRGFVLFIPNTREGDEVRVRVTKVLRKVGFGESIGPAQSTPREDSPPQREEQNVARPLPPEPAPEDTEHFGEDSEDGSSDDSSETFGDEDPVDVEEPSEENMDVPPAPDAPDDEDFGDEAYEEKK